MAFKGIFLSPIKMWGNEEILFGLQYGSNQNIGKI